MVANPVLGLADGYAIATTREGYLDEPDPATRRVDARKVGQKVAGQRAQISCFPDESLPLCRAADELRDSRNRPSNTQAIFLSHIELCLSRFVDQFRVSLRRPSSRNSGHCCGHSHERACRSKPRIGEEAGAVPPRNGRTEIAAPTCRLNPTAVSRSCVISLKPSPTSPSSRRSPRYSNAWKDSSTRRLNCAIAS